MQKAHCKLFLMFRLIKVKGLMTSPSRVLSCLVCEDHFCIMLEIILMTSENVSPGRGTEKKRVGVELRLDASVRVKPVVYFSFAKN